MTAYIDCGSGAAGDMLLGAMTKLGLSARELNQTLRKVIRVKGWKVVVSPVERRGWPARAVTVRGDRPFGSGDAMRAAVARAALPGPVKKRSLQILELLQWAERRAHQSRRDAFEPRGLGLLDTLVDVVGTSWGFWKLGLQDIVCSPVNTGRIAPATAHILRQYHIPVYSTQSQYATPTRTAIIAAAAKEFGPLPWQQFARAGYGAGTRDLAGQPNVLAIYLGSD